MKLSPEERKLRKKELQKRYRQNRTDEWKEEIREYQRQYYLKNIEDIKKRKRELFQNLSEEQREKYKESQRKYNKKNYIKKPKIKLTEEVRKERN